MIKDILVLIYCCAQGFEGNPFFKVLLDTMVLRKSLYLFNSLGKCLIQSIAGRKGCDKEIVHARSSKSWP